MKCLNPACNKPIPKSRNLSAKHCSTDCAYEMKKQRSRNRYASLTKPVNEIQRNQQILDKLYQIQLLGKSINGKDLEKLGFNFGISTAEYTIENKYISKAIGQFAYILEPSSNLKIWKLNIPQ